MPFTQSLLKLCCLDWGLCRFCQPITNWASPRVSGVRGGSLAAATPAVRSHAMAKGRIFMAGKAQIGGKPAHRPPSLAHHGIEDRGSKPGNDLRSWILDPRMCEC